MQLHKISIAVLCVIILTISIGLLLFKQKNTEIQHIELSQLPAKIVVINVWAKWCSSCLAEIQDLNQLNLKLAKNVQVYGYSMDMEDRKTLKKLKKRFDIRYPLISNNIFKDTDITAPSVVPQTYIFNQEGVLKKILLGPQSYGQFEREINKLASLRVSSLLFSPI